MSCFAQFFKRFEVRDGAGGLPVYAFDAYFRKGEEYAAPFILRISHPSYDEKGVCFCRVHCLVLRDEPFTIFGVDDEQAAKLSVSFIQGLLEHEGIGLVDGEGTEIALPDIELMTESRE